jgi:predicted aspartyl protease
MVRRGLLTADKIRSFEANALVDTGAVRSVLPIHVVEHLGLAMVRKTRATYANDVTEDVHITEMVGFDLVNRRTTEEALVLGSEVLIGQTVLESLDLQVDCTNRRVIANPAHPDQPVIKIKCLVGIGMPVEVVTKRRTGMKDGFARYLGALLLIALTLINPTASAQDSSKGAAVFKIPDGYMKAPLTVFRGMMMLDPKKAAGMFVTYPNDDEPTEALRARLLPFLGKMFIHDKGKSEMILTWTTQPLTSHPNDGAGVATANVYTGASQDIQIVIYERTTGVRPFLYGYFAMRHHSGKEDDGEFLDDKGQGVKAFEKLWKSFPK